jgi:hypothetical protein
MSGKKSLKFVSEKEKNIMKINRFIVLIALALLVVSTMGAVTYRASAHGTSVPVTQSQNCLLDQTDGTEVQSASDIDTVDLQCGDQNAPDTGISTTEQDGQEIVSAADTDNVNVEEQVGDQTGADNGVVVPESAQPTQPAPGNP